MLQEVEDLREEGSELGALLETLNESDWAKPTPLKRWTIYDVVGHLHYSDRCALASLKGREAFVEETAAMKAVIDQGGSLRDFTRETLGNVEPPPTSPARRPATATRPGCSRWGRARSRRCATASRPPIRRPASLGSDPTW